MRHSYSVLIVLFFLAWQPNTQAQGTLPTWPVVYPTDNFGSDAMLDLRSLNETTAGVNGFIKLSADGKSFVTANGKPIRFWAVGGGDGTRNMTDEELATYARFLAKVGVNMIRYHGAINAKNEGSSITDVDMHEADRIWRLVAAMKKEGIYTTISPYWAGHISTIPASWGLGEYTGNNKPWALMFFNEKFKEAYKKWVEFLFTTPNPYTNIPLKDEPAVGLIQVKNEDGVFFWTIQDVKPQLKLSIESAFYNWLIQKYQTISKAYEAWNNVTMATDNVAAGRMGIYLIYDATINQTGGKAARVNDMVEFLATHQQQFYTEIGNHYRAIGCKQLINGNNWKTAHTGYLNDAERWSNSTLDVMAVNRYYDPEHTGENRGWRIDPGHKYVGKSVLLQPEKLSTNIKQVYNKPMLITEGGWQSPHKYQAEGPFLVSAYMSLTGVDGFYWFSPAGPGLDPLPYFEFTNLAGGQKAMHRWNMSIPGQILMFPANALLFRKGYITEGTPVVQEERPLAQLWNRTLPLITESSSFDPNRDSWNNAGTPTETAVAPIAYLAGPVTVKYGGNLANNNVSPDLATLLNFPAKTITSNTGQLRWDYKDGICTMDAPHAQGVAGFLKAKGTFPLTDVTIVSENDYATIEVVSMDEKPLATSEKILIQVGTIYQPTNWAETPDKVTINGQEVDGFRILNTGTMPWRGIESRGTVTIKNTRIKAAHALNPAGYKLRELPIVRTSNESFIITLPKDAMYIVLDVQEPTVLRIGKPDIIKVNINIYPNPTQNNFTIEVPVSFGRSNQLQIYDINGRLVISHQNLPSGKHTISLPDLPNGLYNIKLYNFYGEEINYRLLIAK